MLEFSIFLGRTNINMIACLRRFSTAGLATLCATAFAAGGQSAQPAGSAPDALTPAPKRQSFPVIDPALALTGKALLEALQRGGFVLYLRHTETGAITEQCNVTNLSHKGAAAARELGEQLKRLQIPFSSVLSSPVCRVQETAKLLDLGDVELSDDLAQVPKPPVTDLYAARMRQLARVPKLGTNTMLVSHMHAGVPRYQTVDLEFGEIIVFRPEGNGVTKAVSRVLADNWQALSAAKPGSK